MSVDKEFHRMVGMPTETDLMIPIAKIHTAELDLYKGLPLIALSGWKRVMLDLFHKLFYKHPKRLDIYP